MKHEEITQSIIRCFYKVYNTLGYGFLEKIYENALLIELAHSGLKAEKQKKITVYYSGVSVGDYYADILVQEIIILELKAHECIIPEHEIQLINYLKATNIEVGLLLNFGKAPELKRKVFDNNKK